MASPNNEGMGIGDFAQMLLEQEEVTNPVPKKQKPPAGLAGGYVPDIEDIEIKQEDVNEVLNESFGLDRPKPKEASPKRDLTEQKRALKEEIVETVDKLKGLLKQYESVTGLTNSGRFAPFLGGNSGSKKRSAKIVRRR